MFKYPCYCRKPRGSPEKGMKFATHMPAALTEARAAAQRGEVPVGAVLLGSTDEVLLISDGGTLVRTRGSEISRVGRNTQGVTLIRLSKGEKLQAVERLDGSLAEEAEVIGEAVAGDATEQPAAP